MDDSEKKVVFDDWFDTSKDRRVPSSNITFGFRALTSQTMILFRYKILHYVLVNDPHGVSVAYHLRGEPASLIALSKMLRTSAQCDSDKPSIVDIGMTIPHVSCLFCFGVSGGEPGFSPFSSSFSRVGASRIALRGSAQPQKTTVARRAAVKAVARSRAFSNLTR
jgi:hypothetical protein